LRGQAAKGKIREKKKNESRNEIVDKKRKKERLRVWRAIS